MRVPGGRGVGAVGRRPQAVRRRGRRSRRRRAVDSG